MYDNKRRNDVEAKTLVRKIILQTVFKCINKVQTNISTDWVMSYAYSVGLHDIWFQHSHRHVHNRNLRR